MFSYWKPWFRYQTLCASFTAQDTKLEVEEDCMPALTFYFHQWGKTPDLKFKNPFFSLYGMLTALPEARGDACPGEAQISFPPASFRSLAETLCLARELCSLHATAAACSWLLALPMNQATMITSVPPASYRTLVKPLSASCQLLGPILPHAQWQIYRWVLATERAHDWHLKANTLKEMSPSLSASGSL